jgi:hypothetical protein
MTGTSLVAGVALAAAVLTGCTASTRPASPAPSQIKTSVTPSPDRSALRDRDKVAAADDANNGVKSSGSAGHPGNWVVGEVGTYVVGPGMAPGTYQSAVSPTGTCRWARLGAANGASGDIIDHGTATGPITVTIKASDKFFETKGCANWHRIG